MKDLYATLLTQNIFYFLGGIHYQRLNGFIIISRAIEKGAKLVVVDPYLSGTATKAHE